MACFALFLRCVVRVAPPPPPAGASAFKNTLPAFLKFLNHTFWIDEACRRQVVRGLSPLIRHNSRYNGNNAAYETDDEEVLLALLAAPAGE